MAFIDLGYTIRFWRDFFGSFFKSNNTPVPAAPPTAKIEVLSAPPAPQTTTTSENTFLIFDPELIITDKEFLDSSSMTEKQIQEFLELKGTFLKDYKIDDKLTSYWIYKHCSDNGLNPKVLMTNIQKEQATITMKTLPKSKRRLDYFCGVGAYDPPRGDDPKWSGVEKQILGAVQVNVKKYNKALTLKFPYDFTTDKPESRKIKIRNAATMSLYNYTPFVGDTTMMIGKNKYEKPFGNAFFWYIYSRWFGKK